MAHKSKKSGQASNPHAVTVFQIALDMIDGTELLTPPERNTPVPVLAPVNNKAPERIPDEVELVERPSRPRRDRPDAKNLVENWKIGRFQPIFLKLYLFSYPM